MLIVPEHKAVVLSGPKIHQVQAVVPSSRLFTHEGQELLAMPHDIETSIVLRNFGFSDIASPVLYDYDYPNIFGHPPYDAQKMTASFMHCNPRGYILSEFGCGKTASALWGIDYMMKHGRIRRAVVVSTLSTLEPAWHAEVRACLPHRKAIVLHGTAETRKKLLALDWEIAIVNFDGVKSNAETLATIKDIDAVVFDECAYYRNSKTGRWKAARKLIENVQFVWGMTGSPTPQSPTDAYGQAKLITPNTVPLYFKHFRDMVMRQVSSFRWEPRPEANDIITKVLSPSIRFRRKDIVELPPVVEETVSIELPTWHRKLMTLLVSQLAMNYKGHTITAANEAVLASKLLQIACGVIYDEAGYPVDIDISSRVEVVREIYEISEGSMLVFAPFKSIVKAVHAELSGKLLPQDLVHMVTGETPKAERDRIFGVFQRDSTHRHVIVAHPGTMSHGLTLTAASTIIWYAPIYSNETYEQANARITRPGQKNVQVIVHVEGSSVERKIYSRLKKRQSLQNSLLSLIEESI